MGVRVVAEENEYLAGGQTLGGQTETPEPIDSLLRRLSMEPEPPPKPVIVTKRVMPDREILAAMTGLGAVLAVRLMLLLAVVGAFALAWRAMSAPEERAIWILGVYALTIVAPLVWLSTKRT